MRSIKQFSRHLGCIVIATESGKLGSYDAPEGTDVQPFFEDFGRRHWHNSLIWGEGLEQIAIIGEGLIWGRRLTEGLPMSRPAAETPGVGNQAIALRQTCTNPA